MKSSRLFFLREFISSFHTTGAIAPSGKLLARRMTEPLESLPGPRRILEAGPGTGVFSSRILSMLRPEDEFILCEINPEFAAFLKRRLKDDPMWAGRSGQVRVECADVREFFAPGSFDFVISGLPLNNFSPDFVRELLDGFVGSLSPWGVYTFFEYQAIRTLKRRFAPRATARRMTAIQEAVDSLKLRGEVKRIPVYLNTPPAYAYVVKPHVKS